MMCSSALRIMMIISWVSVSNGRSALRIVGGEDGDEDKYPYVVRLLLRIPALMAYTQGGAEGFFCSGALIAPTWTITGGHCLAIITSKKKTPFPVFYYIQAGRADVPESKLNESIKLVEKGILPPGHSNKIYISPKTKRRVRKVHNDIGLVKSEAFTLTQYARISALDYKTLLGLKSTMTGYGLTNVSGKVNYATKLRKPFQTLEVVVVNCAEQSGDQISPKLCIARRCGPTAAMCPGDSGGPLLHSSGIIGVNSMGIRQNSVY